MDLKLTTILPAGDDKQASLILNNLINEQDLVLFIQSGSGKWSEDLVQKADQVAITRKEIRRVVWIKNPDGVKPIITSLIDNSGVDNALIAEPDFAITLSMAGKICDVIRNAEQPDFVRINDAFLKAEEG